MAFDFPSSPSEGQNFAPAGGPLYTYSGGVWRVTTVEEELVAWEDITDKPATFPPTLPIAEADVTNLVTDLAAKEPSLPAGGTTSNFLRGDKTWAVPSGGITDAPNDGKPYVRKSLGWDDFTDDMALKANLAGATFTGKVTVATAGAAGAGLNIPLGTPTGPVDGDCWIVGNVFQWRSSGLTFVTMTRSGTDTVTGIKTFSAKPIMTTPTTATASVNLPHGAAPTTPADGDMWTTSAGLFIRINGVTKQVTLT